MCLNASLYDLRKLETYDNEPPWNNPISSLKRNMEQHGDPCSGNFSAVKIFLKLPNKLVFTAWFKRYKRQEDSRIGVTLVGKNNMGD